MSYEIQRRGSAHAYPMRIQKFLITLNFAERFKPLTLNDVFFLFSELI